MPRYKSKFKSATKPATKPKSKPKPKPKKTPLEIFQKKYSKVDKSGKGIVKIFRYVTSPESFLSSIILVAKQLGDLPTLYEPVLVEKLPRTDPFTNVCKDIARNVKQLGQIKDVIIGEIERGDEIPTVWEVVAFILDNLVEIAQVSDNSDILMICLPIVLTFDAMLKTKLNKTIQERIEQPEPEPEEDEEVDTEEED